jgi:adenylate cyclase
MNRNWLVRLSFPVECALVLLMAALAGFGLMRVQPLTATLVSVAGIVVVTAIAHGLMWYRLVWFDWIVLILEIGVALFCSIVVNSLRLYVEKKLLEQSLTAHLSPKLVKRLVNDASLRAVGGSRQEISIMFSDIANFTRISESMSSDDLVRLMNKYFEAALECIHETDGTVVKLIGDAIFAIWNAPVEQPDHRERACSAALHLREKIVEFNAEHLNLPLRTRVGLHTGDACVGNIGSSNRFDYTALGDSINLTSRLEGLNKYLGTSVLVTREIQRAMEDALVWRPVGHFRLKGFGRAVEVFELISAPEHAGQSCVWREQFAHALHDFRERRFDEAAAKFQATIESRRGVEPEFTTGTTLETTDGPSRFYLEKIAELRAHPPSGEWIGEVELAEK